MPLPPTYLPHLEALLAPQLRGTTTSVEPPTLLAESQAARDALTQELAQAPNATTRSRLEVQLLAAAAADLAVLSRLAPGQDIPYRQDDTTWSLIHTGLTQPENLLQPTMRPPRYRGADKDLLATIYQVLHTIQEDTTETVADAITGALTMNFAVLREAAKLAGTDIRQMLEDLGMDQITAFLAEALTKLLALLGDDNLAHIQETLNETLEKLQEKTAVATYVDAFLETGAIYQQGRALIQAYEGPDKTFAQLTPAILQLEGSFSGRNKLAAALIRLLALAKLIPALKTPPWGPLATASGYGFIIAYELYSAHDHVDSDRFPFFDRVEGVRTLLETRLAT